MLAQVAMNVHWNVSVISSMVIEKHFVRFGFSYGGFLYENGLKYLFVLGSCFVPLLFVYMYLSYLRCGLD